MNAPTQLSEAATWRKVGQSGSGTGVERRFWCGTGEGNGSGWGGCLGQRVGWVFGSESRVGVWVREWGGCLGQRVGWVFGSESGVGVWVRE